MVLSDPLRKLSELPTTEESSGRRFLKAYRMQSRSWPLHSYDCMLRKLSKSPTDILSMSFLSFTMFANLTFMNLVSAFLPFSLLIRSKRV